MGKSSKTETKPKPSRLELPGELLVLGSTWTVELDEELQTNHAEWGITQLRESKIILDPAGDLPSVVLHELWHVIDSLLRPNIHDDESLAQAAAVGYRAVFSDNPDFRAWFFQEVS